MMRGYAYENDVIGPLLHSALLRQGHALVCHGALQPDPPFGCMVRYGAWIYNDQDGSAAGWKRQRQPQERSEGGVAVQF